MKRRVTNRIAREYVQRKEAFITSTGNLWSTVYGDSSSKRYVVFSYGPHWPLFIYDYNTDTWFENADKTSHTTSTHRSAAHPHTDTLPLNCDQMVELSDHGYKKFIKQRLKGEAA